MPTYQSIIEESEKWFPKLNRFGEMRDWPCTNLQMLYTSICISKAKCDRSWYVVRGELFEDNSKQTYPLPEYFCDCIIKL